MRRIEQREVILLLLLGLFIGSSQAIYDVVSVTLFLKSFEINFLPVAILCSGLLGVLASSLFSFLQNRLSFGALAILVYLGAMANNIILFVLIDVLQGHSWFFFTAFIAITPVNTIVLLVFWGTFGRLFDVRQSRRLQSGINSGIIVSSIIALYSIPLLHGTVFGDFRQLLIMSTIGLFLAAITLLVILAFYFEKLNVKDNIVHIKANNNLKTAIRNPYVSKLAFYAVGVGLIFTLVEFSFLAMLDVEFDIFSTTDAVGFSEQNILADFLGIFNGTVLVVALLIQTFLNDWIIGKYGLKVSLMIMPVLMAIFAVAAIIVGFVEGFSFSSGAYSLFFITVCIYKLILVSTRDSLEIPAFKAYFLPIEAALRLDIQAKIEGVIKEFSKFIGGGVILLCGLFTFFEVMHYSFLLLAVLGGIIYMIAQMYKGYKKALEDSLKREQEASLRKKQSFELVERLVELSAEVPENLYARYLNILNILDPIIYRKAILHILERKEDGYTQAVALKQASLISLLEAIPILDRVIESKYFPVLENRELIQQTYDRLRGAEFRLERLKYIEQLTLSKLTDERMFGALLTAYASEEMKPRLLNKLFKDPNYRVRFNAVSSAINTENADIFNNLLEKLNQAQYSNVATAAMVATGESCIDTLEAAFYLSGQALGIQLRIVQIYGRIGTEKAIRLLWTKLGYPNQNVVSGVLKALSHTGYNAPEDEALPIRREVEDFCETAIWNMAAYLNLEAENVSERLLQAIEVEVENNIKTVFHLLALLYDETSVRLVERSLDSGNPNEAEYAIELLNIFLSEETKPFLLPILSDDTYDEKVKRVKDIYPTNAMPAIEVIHSIIQRDYKKVNRWTKVCALREMERFYSNYNVELLAAHLVNPDLLLKEVAAKILLDQYSSSFEEFKERYQNNSSYELRLETIQKLMYKGEEDEKLPKLKFEIVEFLNQNAAFNHVSGYVLCEVANCCDLVSFKAKELINIYRYVDTMDYYIVVKGNVVLTADGCAPKTYEHQDFIHPYDLIEPQKQTLTLTAETDCVLLSIDKFEFNELLTFYDEIPENILESPINPLLIRKAEAIEEPTNSTN